MNKLFDLVVSMGGQPQGAAPSQDAGSGMMMTILMLGAMFAIMYFVVLRPQMKEQKKHQAMLKALKKGDKVITSGGIYGVVVGISDAENKVVVRIDENVKVEVAKAYVVGVKSEGPAELPADKK